MDLDTDVLAFIYIFIVKVNGIANVTATTIIAKYCDFDNFVELHKP